MVPMQLTDEQAAVVEAARAGRSVTAEALAGTGKSATCTAVAHTLGDRKVLYLAYNKAAVLEARRRFAGSPARAAKIHAMAFKALGRHYASRDSRVTGLQSMVVRAKLLDVHQPAGVSRNPQRRPLTPARQASLAIKTVRRFAQSGDDHIGSHHVPPVLGYDHPDEVRAICSVVLPLALRAWNDLVDRRGSLTVEPDHWLKMWALGRPSIEADLILLDEAQDSNGVVVELLRSQRHVQMIAVGDRHQTLYRWRGSEGAMDAFSDEVLQLTQSFRFGPAVAEEANKWLELCGSAARLTGNPAVASRLAPSGPSSTVLCRSNAGAVAEVMHAQRKGQSSRLSRGGDAVAELAKAAEDLRETGQTTHPELFAFGSWEAVEEYAEEDDTAIDLRLAVRLINTHGAVAVLAAIERSARVGAADVVASTAHSSKGQQWTSVRISDDFFDPTTHWRYRDDGQVPVSEAMLAYVAVTRAQHHLDVGGLAFVDRLLCDRRRAAAQSLPPADARP